MTEPKQPKQVKHTIQLEFTIPENYGDLCWTTSDGGIQMYYDLLVKQATSMILKNQSSHYLKMNKRGDQTETESDKNYLSYLERNIELINAIKVTNIGTEFI